MSSALLPRGIENTGTLRGESANQPRDQTAAAAAHRRHTHNCLGPAIVCPAATHRRNQLVEVGGRGRFFAGELSGGDAVAPVAKSDDLAFQVPRGESFRHVLGQRTTVQPHAVQRDGTTIAPVGGRCEEIELSATLAPQGDNFRQAIGGGMVGLVEEQGFARKIVRHSLRLQAVQGGMCTSESIILGAVMTKIGDQPACGIELLAGTSAQDQPFRDFDVRRSDSLARREGDEPIIGMDERMFDLLLRCRDHGMGKALAELHRHQGDDLHRFAGAGWLFDKHRTIGSAHIGDEAGLIRTERLTGCGVQGGFSWQAETQENFTRKITATKGPLCARTPCRG